MSRTDVCANTENIKSVIFTLACRNLENFNQVAGIKCSAHVSHVGFILLLATKVFQNLDKQ